MCRLLYFFFVTDDVAFLIADEIDDTTLDAAEDTDFTVDTNEETVLTAFDAALVA